MGEESRKIELDNVIEAYVESICSENLKEEMVRACFKTKVVEDISEEICEKKSDEIKKLADEKINKEEQYKRKKEMKVLIIETLIFGFFIGLLVNQSTDAISILKGAEINLGYTLIIMLILITVNIIIGFLVYMNKLDDFLYKINKNDCDTDS